MLCLTSSIVSFTIVSGTQEIHSHELLSYGQVYGTAVYVHAGISTDASDIVLLFESKHNRSLVLAQKNGDYIALLEPGKYCVKAYTRKGVPVSLDSRQQTCIEVLINNDSRFDVMLHQNE
jgi:hypothetical protein